jgi:lipoprotein signal peptidase
MAIGGLLSNLADRFVYGGVRNPVSYGIADWNWADLLSLVGLIICLVYFGLNKLKGGDAR